METDRNFVGSTRGNLFTFLLDYLSLYVQSLVISVRQTSQIINMGIGKFQTAELPDSISDALAEHPPLKFLVFATAFSCVIPVAMFVVFGITSTIIMFAGFLFIEGTLLALGGLCMFICIATLILVLSAFAMILGVFYMLALKLGYIINKRRTQMGNMIADAHQD